MNISISKDANKNYLAKVVELKDLQKHANADRLQTVQIDFQTVITGLEAKDGDKYVFFPLECCINKEFLAKTNSFRDAFLNEDDKIGFFEKNGRVKAMKLRGEKSMGYIVPVKIFYDLYNIDLNSLVGKEFDTINDTIICEKFFVPVKEQGTLKNGKQVKRISRMVDGQVHLHVDTENLRKNIAFISPDDRISITYKVHGTSFWVSNVLVKSKLSIAKKVLRTIGVGVKDTEYDIVYGSRKVVKNEYETQHTMDFYGGDLWGKIADELRDKLPKGYTIYGECLGYTEGGAYIQKPYDYGCEKGQHRLQVYRITVTNEDGLVHNLSTMQMQEFCDKNDLECVARYFVGQAKFAYPDLDTENHWHEEFIKKLEEDFNEKKCHMCKNDVPEEGIALRVEKADEFKAYKLKSFAFLEHETKMMDEGQEDLESNN